MRRWLRWLVPAVVMALGMAVAFAGFAYDLMLAGIPYQDPTPELEAQYRFHSGVASAIEYIGVTVLAAGLAGILLVGVWSLLRKEGRVKPSG